MSKKAHNQISTPKPDLILIEKYDLFETTNPALKPMNDFIAEISPVGAQFEEEVKKNIDMIVNRVWTYFKNQQGAGNGEDRKAVPPEHATTQPPAPSFKGGNHDYESH